MKEKITKAEFINTWASEWDEITGWKVSEEYHKQFSEQLESIINQEVEKRIAERIPSEEDKAIRKFFLWMVREANIEVIDAEKAIEVHSLESEVGLVPVISIDELIEYYRFRLTCSEKPNNSQKTEGIKNLFSF